MHLVSAMAHQMSVAPFWTHSLVHFYNLFYGLNPKHVGNTAGERAETT